MHVYMYYFKMKQCFDISSEPRCTTKKLIVKAPHLTDRDYIGGAENAGVENAGVENAEAFSTPAIYSCIFYPCSLLPYFPLLHFHPCNYAHAAFSTPAFSVAPLYRRHTIYNSRPTIYKNILLTSSSDVNFLTYYCIIQFIVYYVLAASDNF